MMKIQNQARRCAALLLALFLLLPLTACGGGAKATSMHLKRTEGTVAVSDDGGKDVALLDNLGLYSGYGVDTSSESYAWINLDDVKLTKMDQDSEIGIQKDGKALEIEVKSGSLFFNVTEPLEDDETLNIRTSTMLVGIRGTCGWVEDNNGLSRVYLLEGKVECSAGEQTVTVSAGEMAELTADGKLVVKPFTVEDVSAFVRPEVEDREELTAELPTSQFKSNKLYVDESELSAETKELLRRILDAAQAENWNEARDLALSTIDIENIAGDGEYAMWHDSGMYDRERGFYSEFDGYRVCVVNKTGDDVKVAAVDIRPESGKGCYVSIDQGAAIGQCENYNWTDSFLEWHFYGINRPTGSYTSSNLPLFND